MRRTNMASNNIALMRNGIVQVVGASEDEFIQYNDYFEHKSFFQCPKCLSLNVEKTTTYLIDIPYFISKACTDCGYVKNAYLSKEAEND